LGGVEVVLLVVLVGEEEEGGGVGRSRSPCSTCEVGVPDDRDQTQQGKKQASKQASKQAKFNDIAPFTATSHKVLHREKTNKSVKTTLAFTKI